MCVCACVRVYLSLFWFLSIYLSVFVYLCICLSISIHVCVGRKQTASLYHGRLAWLLWLLILVTLKPPSLCILTSWKLNQLQGRSWQTSLSKYPPTTNTNNHSQFATLVNPFWGVGVIHPTQFFSSFLCGCSSPKPAFKLLQAFPLVIYPLAN